MEFKLFGDWRTPGTAELSERGKMIVAFLSGTAEPSAELNAVLLEEFKAQERYRSTMHQHLVSASRALADATEANVAELEIARGPDEQYAAGYHAGLYRAYADAAQMVGAIDAAATAEVVRDEPPKKKREPIDLDAKCACGARIYPEGWTRAECVGMSSDACEACWVPK